MKCLSVSFNLIQQCHVSAGGKICSACLSPLTLYNNVTSVQVGTYAVSVCLLNPYATMSYQCRWDNMQCLSVSPNLIQQCHISAGGKICSVCLSPLTLCNNVISVQVETYAVPVCLL